MYFQMRKNQRQNKLAVGRSVFYSSPLLFSPGVIREFKQQRRRRLRKRRLKSKFGRLFYALIPSR